MPRPSIISTLPPAVREQLDRRLVASGFGDTVEIAAWLSSQGFTIGKSAVAQYAKVQADGILDRFSDSSYRRAMLRLRCLELAHQLGTSAESLQAKAAELLAWSLGD